MLRWYHSSDCVICLPVKNCAQFLPKIFNNIKKMEQIFNKFAIIFGYDYSYDNSLEFLTNFKNFSRMDVNIIVNNITLKKRTWRIANIRNKMLNMVRNKYKDFEYFIMMDSDGECHFDINIKPIIKYLKRKDWDCLTFNRHFYYDAWALQYEPFIHNCYGFGIETQKIPSIMMRDIKNKLSKLKDGELFECYSAFNGFAIYRKNKFINIEYNGTIPKYFPNDKIQNLIILLKEQYKLYNIYINEKQDENCEHIGFHINAIRNNNAKIRIAKEHVLN